MKNNLPVKNALDDFTEKFFRAVVYIMCVYAYIIYLYNAYCILYILCIY